MSYILEIRSKKCFQSKKCLKSMKHEESTLVRHLLTRDNFRTQLYKSGWNAQSLLITIKLWSYLHLRRRSFWMRLYLVMLENVRKITFWHIWQINFLDNFHESNKKNYSKFWFFFVQNVFFFKIVTFFFTKFYFYKN